MWTDSSIAKWHREADPQKGPRCSFLVLLSEIYKQAPGIGHPETVQENASRFLYQPSPRKSPGGLIQDFNSENKTEMALLHVPHEQGWPVAISKGPGAGPLQKQAPPRAGLICFQDSPSPCHAGPWKKKEADGQQRTQEDCDGHEQTGQQGPERYKAGASAHIRTLQDF